MPGIMDGTQRPDYSKSVELVTASAIKLMLLPAAIPIAVPIIVGIINERALGGLLIGTIVTGIFLAIAMTAGGGAWDNAKKLIEDGAHAARARRPTQPRSRATRSAIPTRTPPGRRSTR